MTGAPYCADEVSEHQQTLADGTHIDQTFKTAHVCRDSAGRTRTERPLLRGPRAGTTQAAAGMQVIEIRDPVAGYQYTLDMQNKVAHRVKLPPGNAQPGRIAKAQVQGSVSGVLGVLPAVVPAPGPVAVSGTPDSSPRPEMTTEALGTQTFNGVVAQGTLHKTVYPVNYEGNDRPITVTHESWMSPDLKLMVMSKNADPRSGDQINRLDNLTPGEPDASLFQISADYQISDEQGPFQINMRQ